MTPLPPPAGSTRAVWLHAVTALAVGFACATLLGHPSTTVAYPDDPVVHYTGWFDRRAPRDVRFAWPGTHITVPFTGTAIAADLTDTPMDDDTRETDWLAVIVDGEAPRALGLAEGRHTYALASGLAPGAHRLVMWKRTEAEVGTVTFHGVTIAGGAVRPARTRAPVRRMIVFGDSVTAGYGSDGPGGPCHWSAASEDSYAAFGAVASRELGTEYVAAAWSGKGVTRNYEARDHLTLPEIVNRVIPTEDDSPPAPSGFVDIVVVNAGTNDFFQGLPDERTFVEAYGRFLASLRARYPGALFVLGLGPMLADDYPQPQARAVLRRWMESVRGQRQGDGDDRIELMELWADPSEGVGCDAHPTAATHARLGRELAAFVRARLGW